MASAPSSGIPAVSAASPPRERYRRIAGPARLYIDRAGISAPITYPVYRNLLAKQVGWSSFAEYQKFNAATFGALGGPDSPVASLIIGTLLAAGYTTEKERRGIPRRLAHELRALARDHTSLEYDKPLAKWLTALGLRDAGWTVNVGDSPKLSSADRTAMHAAAVARHGL